MRVLFRSEALGRVRFPDSQIFLAATVARRPDQRAGVGGYGIGLIFAPGTRNPAFGARRHDELRDPGIGGLDQARARILTQELRQFPPAPYTPKGPAEGFFRAVIQIDGAVPAVGRSAPTTLVAPTP